MDGKWIAYDVLYAIYYTNDNGVPMSVKALAENNKPAETTFNKWFNGGVPLHEYYIGWKGVYKYGKS